MEKAATLFGKYEKVPDKRRVTERSEIYDQILSRLNPSRARAGYKPLTYGALGCLLEGVETKDIYALLSKCADAERRGYDWSAIFWLEIRPPKPSNNL